MYRIAFAAVIASLAISASAAEPASAPKLKGLLVTGGCCHDYTNQALIITEGLGQRMSISFDVIHEGGDGRDHKVSVYNKPGWASGYDVIVHNECFGGVMDDDFVKGIAQAHFDGVPAVFIHCSLHSYRSAPTGADAWRELIGVTSRRHEKHRAVTVQNVEPEDPIMRGFPLEWATPNGELYIIEKTWPNARPLAQAYGTDTQKVHTVAWTNTFGKARVFGTSLGHHNETMNNDIWLGMFCRGVLWACDALDENGNPRPGFEGSGVKPIELPALKPSPDTKR